MVCQISYTPQPNAGDARWFNCVSLQELKGKIRQLDGLDESVEPLYASHGDIIERSLQRLTAER